MLTTFDTDEYIGHAMDLGAAGFLLKDTDPEGLAEYVRVLARGGVVLAPGVHHRSLFARLVPWRRDRRGGRHHGPPGRIIRTGQPTPSLTTRQPSPWWRRHSPQEFVPGSMPVRPDSRSRYSKHCCRSAAAVVRCRADQACIVRSP